jgi:hypothetical protein
LAVAKRAVGWGERPRRPKLNAKAEAKPIANEW